MHGWMDARLGGCSWGCTAGPIACFCVGGEGACLVARAEAVRCRGRLRYWVVMGGRAACAAGGCGGVRGINGTVFCSAVRDSLVMFVKMPCVLCCARVEGVMKLARKVQCCPRKVSRSRGTRRLRGDFGDGGWSLLPVNHPLNITLGIPVTLGITNVKTLTHKRTSSHQKTGKKNIHFNLI